MAEFEVVEIFDSINGEGRFAGELANFVRLKGCNLRCSYCDTAWACEETAACRRMSEEEICQRLLQSGIRRVTLTGGEPLAAPHIEVLLQRLLMEETLLVEVETNGSIPVARFRRLERVPMFTFDYKLAGSGMEQAMCPENFQEVAACDTVKFVVCDRADLERTEEIVRKYALSEKCTVILSPVFTRIEPVEIVEFLRERRWNHVRLQLQLHKYIWDANQRGV